jgi:hypothetical protein
MLLVFQTEHKSFEMGSSSNLGVFNFLSEDGNTLNFMNGVLGFEYQTTDKFQKPSSIKVHAVKLDIYLKIYFILLTEYTRQN